MISKPLHNITEKAADYLAKIVEIVTRIEYGTSFKRNIKLHQANRLRTIHSSLAIEGNSLSLAEVSAVIEGELVAGKQTEIKEVKTPEAYDKIMSFAPYNIEDFNGAPFNDRWTGKGKQIFRSGDVGVFDGNMAVHIESDPICSFFDE